MNTGGFDRFAALLLLLAGRVSWKNTGARRAGARPCKGVVVFACMYTVKEGTRKIERDAGRFGHFAALSLLAGVGFRGGNRRC